MKTLTKIKLINWQGFYDETIPVKGSILITGENGSGKSSLIDALYFLLTGGEQDFNAAANDKNDRKVETYMRGTTGEIGHPDLRTDPSLISHIALEFYNQEEKQYFVIGAVLEIQEGKNRTGRGFYHLKQTRMSDDLFMEMKDGKKVYLNFAAMKKRNKDLNDLGDTKQEIRRSLYSILSLEGGKYFELLPKAVSFKPIDDVDDFVYRFLMPEKNVSIKEIQENIKTYNETLKIVELDQEKMDCLSNITQRGNLYRTTLRDLKLSQAYQKKRAVEKDKLAITNCERTIAEETNRQESLKEEKKKNSDQIQEISETKYSIEHDEQFQEMRRVKENLERFKHELAALERKSSDLSQKVRKEKEIASDFKIPNHLGHCVEEENFSELKSELTSYQAKLEEIREVETKSKNDFESQKARQDDKLNELNETFEKLKKGLPTYPIVVSSLIEVIRNGLKQRLNVDVAPTPFCELLEITPENEEWRNAVEGYLNTRRFDLFVPKQYFDEALRLYEKYKAQRHISGVGLVNIEKLSEEGHEPCSLAEKVIPQSENARRYADYLLGKIICVDSEDDLKKHAASITKTVMVYKNKAARQTKFEIYATPYIGRNSIKIKLEQVKSQIDETQKSIDELKKQIAEKERILRHIGESKVQSLLSSEDYWQQKKLKKIDVETAQASYDKLNETYGKITKEIQDLEDRISILTAKNSSLDKANEASVSSKTRCEEQKKTAEQDLSESKARLDGFLKDREVQSGLENFAGQNSGLSDSELTSRIGNDSKSLDGHKDKLIVLMTSYIERFQFDATAEIDSLDDFYNEQNNVLKRHFATYKDKLESVKKNAEITFQNSYIADISKHIRDEKENIKALNQILSDKPFGAAEEIYQFEISASKDPVFRSYYDIFLSGQDYSNRDLFTDVLSETNLTLMDDLFKRLTTETTDEKSLKMIRDFTDYRKFMSYDIIIKNKYGKTYRFSKISKSKSGGETQTPFYVIIAASFDQIMKGGQLKNQSKGCIVMFDEAFEKMDEAHVDSMMQFFRKLSIQPIIAVPSRSAKPIMPYVDTVLGLVKVKDRIFPSPMIKETIAE